MSYTSWKSIAENLQRKIANGELKPGDLLPTGEQIAQEWGVNRHTAHRAIEELQRAGLVTRRRGHGTVVNAPRRTDIRQVALLVDCYAPGVNFPSVDLIRGIQDRLGEGVSVVVAESKADPEFEIRQLARLSQETDGIVLYSTCRDASTPELQKLAASSFPLVLVDRMPPGLVADAVITDNEGAAARAVEALVRYGHRNIGFMSFHKPSFSSVAERHAGFLRAMAEAGIEDPDAFTRWLPLGSSHVRAVFEQLIRDAVFSLTKGERPITALFCVEDSVATAVIQASARLGLTVPDDLEIATFSDWQPTALGAPWNVHRIVQRNYEIGQAAAGLLLDRIAHERSDRKLIRVPTDFLAMDAGVPPSTQSLSS